MSDYESRREDAKREDWEDRYGHLYAQACPRCGEQTFDRTYYDAGDRYGRFGNPEPPCEEWQCRNCDYVEG